MVLRCSGRVGCDPEAAVPHHHGRHAVPGGGREVAVPEHLGVVVGVGVDEAGGEHQPVQVDDGLRGPHLGTRGESPGRTSTMASPSTTTVARRRSVPVPSITHAPHSAVVNGPSLRPGAPRPRSWHGGPVEERGVALGEEASGVVEHELAELVVGEQAPPHEGVGLVDHPGHLLDVPVADVRAEDRSETRPKGIGLGEGEGHGAIVRLATEVEAGHEPGLDVGLGLDAGRRELVELGGHDADGGHRAHPCRSSSGLWPAIASSP